MADRQRGVSLLRCLTSFINVSAMSRVAGWAAIILVLFAIAISIVPGAISLIGMTLSILAVAISLFSVRMRGRAYFGTTISLALAGILLVNDSLRIWYPLPLPFNLKIGLYSVVLVVLALCSFAAYRLGSNHHSVAR